VLADSGVRGAGLGLVGCMATVGVQGSGLLVRGEGTCVEAIDSTFSGSGWGVLMKTRASMQLDKCIATSNNEYNFGAPGGAT
jgi:hypothetical protein